MNKKKVLSFNETLRSWQLWVSSFAYHISAFIINKLIPIQVANKANEIVFIDKSSLNIPKIADLSQITVNKPFYINPAIAVNILIFDALFVLIFIIAQKSKSKRYNIYAVIFSIIITNMVFFINIL
jgi:hypothetical protein